MSVEFDWQVSEDEFEEDEQRLRSAPPWLRWLLLAFLLLMVGAIGGGLWWRVYSAELQLRQSAQFVLDLEHQAYLNGDGDLFFSVYDPDDLTFQSTQLRPDHQAIHAANQQVTHAEQHGDVIWANVAWEQDGTTHQRIAFFHQTENGLLHIASDLIYWGNWHETPFDWGMLRVRDADVQWVEPLAERLATVIDPFEGEPPTIVIRDDFQVSTLANVIHYPSPRLLGLDESGELSDHYLDGLAAEVGSYFRPITIRFAMPNRTRVDMMTSDLIRAAEAFSAQYPPGQVTVELLIQEKLDGPPESWLPTVDAASLPATEAYIAQGLLTDLTDFAARDTEFDHGDFYNQAWRGAWWDDRMWMVPWNTSFSLLFFNRNHFRTHDAPQPIPEWSWDELGDALAHIADGAGTHSFIDPTRDTLFAYAYAQDQSCRNRDNCLPKLTEDGVAATLEWYRKLTLQDGSLYDISGLPPMEREQAMLRSLSTRKEVAAWVDSPINYEYQLGLQVTDVQSFVPNSAETPLVMPIRVDGLVMSSSTENPYWTWQWLKYVSHLPPTGAIRRNIPARPSLVRQTKFWAWMPEQLATPMQNALPVSRPILIGEERYFTWEMLAAAVNGEIATKPTTLRWFGR